MNATTGGRKGSKIQRFDLVPVGPLTKVAEHYGVGAEKYEDRNWERGYAWSLSYAAAQRHLTQFWSGQDDDPETGTPHLAAVIFHCMSMMEWRRTHPDLDDRPKSKPSLRVVLAEAIKKMGTQEASPWMPNKPMWGSSTTIQDFDQPNHQTWNDTE